MIDPSPVVNPDGFNDECVALPATDGVSIPSQIGIFRQLPAIGPNGAPHMRPLPELNHTIRKLDDFDGTPEKEQTRPTQRIAVANRIIS